LRSDSDRPRTERPAVELRARLQPFDGGVVQRHVTRGEARAGETIEFPCCIVFRIADGRITALHEYLDSAAVTPVFG
jgi:ketosteroid isomerase-like protein